MRNKFIKIISVLVAVIIAFSFNCISVSAETKPYTVRMPFSQPQLTENSGYLEILVSNGDADTDYVGAVIIGWDICNDTYQNDNFVQIKYDSSKKQFQFFPNSSYSGTFNYYLITSDGAQTYYSELITENYYTWFNVSNVLNVKVYGNYSNVDIPFNANYDFAITYGESIDIFYNMRTIINLLTSQGNKITDMAALLLTVKEYTIYQNSNLEKILKELQQGNSAIIESQNQNSSQIQQNQDENTDKVLNGDEDLDSSGETDKVDGTIGGIDDATNNALGGKSEEDIQNEVGGALDTDNLDIDWTKANRMSTFYDRCLKAFGSEYSTLLLLSLILGLSAFLIGRRYG